jgi:hypothetical protein
MSIVESAVRFRAYIDQMIALLRDYEVRTTRDLIRVTRSNDAFRSEWKSIWGEIAEADGGSLSVGTAGAVLGAVLGGVGIAAGGTAIGLPLLAVLGVVGFFAGGEVDSIRAFSGRRTLLLRLPKPLYKRISDGAKVSGISMADEITNTLAAAFPDQSEF